MESNRPARPAARKLVGSRDALPQECVDDPAGPMTTWRLGEAGGSERLYANIDRLRPGAKSAKFHSHSRQEEFFLVLRGACALRVNGETLRLKAGDFFCKPAGRGIAHQFINDSKQPVEILDVGLNAPNDIAYYPDEGVRYARKGRRAFHGRIELAGWSSDPNAGA